MNLNSHFSSRIDLLVIFVSAHFQTQLKEITECLQTQLSRHLIGGTGESIVYDATEIEASPAISSLRASLPETQIDSMRLTFERTPDGGTIELDSLGSEWDEGCSHDISESHFRFPGWVAEQVSRRSPGLAGCRWYGIRFPNAGREPYYHRSGSL